MGDTETGMINNIRFCGGHGPGETPGPIPNPEAKPWHGDGTMLERAWESSKPPQHNVDEGPRKATAFRGPFSIPGHDTAPSDVRGNASLYTSGSSVLLPVREGIYIRALSADAFRPACARRFLYVLLADASCQACTSRLVRAQLADAFCALHVREFPRAPMAGAFCQVHAGEQLCAPVADAFCPVCTRMHLHVQTATPSCWSCMKGLPDLHLTVRFRQACMRRFLCVHVAVPFRSLHIGATPVHTTAGSYFAGGDTKRSADTVHALVKWRKIAVLQKRIRSPSEVLYPHQQIGSRWRRHIC